MPKVLCPGTVPGTDGERCDETAFVKDGDHLVLIAPKSRLIRLETNPLRLTCRKCGYKMKLVWKDRKR